MTETPSQIVVVGLGPGNPDSRTIAAQRALDAANAIILRTRVHPGLEDLANDPRVTDCDDLYQGVADFDRLYPAIAKRVLERAKTGIRVVFAVPGHPRFGERSVPLIEVGAKELGIPVIVQDAVSFIDAAVSLTGVDPLAAGLQVTDAEHLAAILDAVPFAAGLLGVDPARPLLVAQLYNTELAVATKLALSRAYPEDHRVMVVRAAGVRARNLAVMTPLHALDRQEIDHLTSLWVPPLAPLEAGRSPETLLRIVARLRRPDGCPWDRQQSHPTLRDAILEEAYETVDAIDAADGHALAEELGDLLLLIAMHAQIAEEEGSFTIEDVYEGIARKLIRRHPHVFAAEIAETPDAVIATWDGVKAAERAAKGTSGGPIAPVDRLPRSMPAVRKAVELLAPRRVLGPPAEPGAGDSALAAIGELIAAGIDPERALEMSLRSLSRPEEVRDRPVGAGSGIEREKGLA